MKKTILLLTLFLCTSITVISCKDSKKETEAEQTELGVEKADMAMNDVYICPMGCEKDKTYDKGGKCPVCKMDLKKVENKEESDSDSDNHDHDDESDKQKDGE